MNGFYKEVSNKIAQDIEEYCESLAPNSNKLCLTSYIIGGDCAREIWYMFRWAKEKKYNGRQARVFGRNEENTTLINNLLRFSNIAMTKFKEAKYLQSGHFESWSNGSTFLPEKYGINEEVLICIKNSMTGHYFTALTVEGVKKIRPLHYAEMCVDGAIHGLSKCLYINLCKNDENLYIELVDLSREFGAQLLDKAEKIICSENEPKKLSDNQNNVKCSTCYFKLVCHENEPADKNCRTCLYSMPVDKGEWECSLYEQNIPINFQPIGCEKYESFINI